MNDKKKLDIPALFKSEAEEIKKAREDAIRIHGTSDIRAAGNEVEICVRNYFRRMHPPKYYVTHGHLIDINGNVSSQLDLIIADNFNLPSLMTTKDGTEYIPIDSVYAFGEIKSTYDKSAKPIDHFSSVLEDIRQRLYHEDIPNTAYGGIQANTLIRDSFLEKGNRILNRLFAFMLFVNGDDFEFDDIRGFYNDRDKRYMPSVVTVLNKGMIIRASLEENRFTHNRYPEDQDNDREDWFFAPLPPEGSASLEGNHLGFLYYSLLEHLSNSYLEPPSLKGYLHSIMAIRKSLLRKANPT